MGLIEKAQFAFLPLGGALQHLASNRQSELLQLVNRGFVIPRSNNKQERIRTVEEIIAKDKGGGG